VFKFIDPCLQEYLLIALFLHLALEIKLLSFEVSQLFFLLLASSLQPLSLVDLRFKSVFQVASDGNGDTRLLALLIVLASEHCQELFIASVGFVEPLDHIPLFFVNRL